MWVILSAPRGNAYLGRSASPNYHNGYAKGDSASGTRSVQDIRYDAERRNEVGPFEVDLAPPPLPAALQFLSDHRVAQHAELLNFDFDNVARLQQYGRLSGEADAVRRTGEDQVAGR